MVSMDPLLVKLLAFCIIDLLILAAHTADRVDCFSTPSNRARKVMKSTMRNVNNLGYGTEPLDRQDENDYVANFITAIEDHRKTGGKRAFMVSTTDHNYAIYSSSLLKMGWQTLTVNGDQVFIVTTSNKTISQSLFKLDEEQRDFIAEVKSEFTQNLGGLKFAHYTSGSSIHLTKMAETGKQPTRQGLYPLPMSATYSTGHSSINNEPTKLDIPIVLSTQTTKYQQIEQTTLPPSGLNLFESQGLPPSANQFFSRNLNLKSAPVTDKQKRSEATQLVRHRYGRRRKAGRSPWGARTRVNKPMQMYEASLYTPTTGNTPATSPATPITLSSSPTNNAERLEEPSMNLCRANRFSDNFNYYNLIQAQLNTTLTGDVYYFDLHCNILDVYSSTVSIRQHDDLSALYRDYNFFSYARSGLPLAINRFFLVDDQVFFVYNDGSTLVKLSWMLDQTELEIAIEARQRLKLVGQWQGKAADLLSKSVKLNKQQ